MSIYNVSCNAQLGCVINKIRLRPTLLCIPPPVHHHRLEPPWWTDANSRRNGQSRNNFYLPHPHMLPSLGVIHLEFHQDLRHKKTNVYGPLWGPSPQKEGSYKPTTALNGKKRNSLVYKAAIHSQQH